MYGSVVSAGKILALACDIRLMMGLVESLVGVPSFAFGGSETFTVVVRPASRDSTAVALGLLWLDLQPWMPRASAEQLPVRAQSTESRWRRASAQPPIELAPEPFVVRCELAGANRRQ